jgi:hypothetical protein
MRKRPRLSSNAVRSRRAPTEDPAGREFGDPRSAGRPAPRRYEVAPTVPYQGEGTRGRFKLALGIHRILAKEYFAARNEFEKYV